MPWTPTRRILRPSHIPGNLMTFIEANQVDAILWAHGSALRPIAKFSDTVANRAVPIYPAISFSNDADAQLFLDDFVNSGYAATFELLIQSSAADTAVSEARSYAAAVASMILNCPLSVAMASVGADAEAAVLESIQTEFAEIRTNEMQNDFLQQVQIRATYRLTAAAKA